MWKVFFLKEIYREYLLSESVPENRIIILELDDDKNSKFRDPLELGAYIREECAGEENYYVFIDEIQKAYSITPPRSPLLFQC
jgi:predicted AAA+ superfamily ATPase